MGNDNQTFTVEKDGTVVIKDSEGADVRYVKEADLLAIKGSRDAAERKVRDSEATHTTAIETVRNETETFRQKALQAEAKISGLEERLAAGGSKEELERVKQELEAAKTSGEGLSNKLLGLRRTLITTTYGVPVATVEKKTLDELDTFEEALKAVIGAKGIGNYAAGGGSGGNALTGKSPIELARLAYETSKK